MIGGSNNSNPFCGVIVIDDTILLYSTQYNALSDATFITASHLLPLRHLANAYCASACHCIDEDPFVRHSNVHLRE